ncbi:hypothetical protein B5K11_26995 [Rhizobium leguminosarum bv. trifolii]|nr:hypothetical protein B5K11_26995 [Rhizobium leguminosarum bv. trifolii]
MWNAIRRYFKIYSELLDSDPREDEKFFTAAIGGGCVMVWPEPRRPKTRSADRDSETEEADGAVNPSSWGSESRQ